MFSKRLFPFFPALVLACSPAFSAEDDDSHSSEHDDDDSQNDDSQNDDSQDDDSQNDDSQNDDSQNDDDDDDQNNNRHAVCGDCFGGYASASPWQVCEGAEIQCGSLIWAVQDDTDIIDCRHRAEEAPEACALAESENQAVLQCFAEALTDLAPVHINAFEPMDYYAVESDSLFLTQESVALFWAASEGSGDISWAAPQVIELDQHQLESCLSTTSAAAWSCIRSELSKGVVLGECFDEGSEHLG